MIKKVVSVLLILSCISFSLYAEEYSPIRKLTRGAVNLALGVVEIPKQTLEVSKESGDVAGIFWGPIKGLMYFVGRTVLGAYEVVTFVIPPYKPLMEPEFIFSEEDETLETEGE